MSKFLGKGIRWLKHRFDRNALILVYHRIDDSSLDPWSLSVRQDHFAEHLAVLRRSFYPTSLQQMARELQGDEAVNHKSIIITFDDGYADNLHAALPLLQRFDIPATMFLITGAIGCPEEFWWDELTSLLLKPHPLPAQLELSIGGRIFSWQLSQATEYSEVDYKLHSGWRAAQPPPTFRHVLYMQLWQLIHPLPSDSRKKVMNDLRIWARYPSNSGPHRILNEEDCIELAQGAGIEIGAHTVNHPSLASLSVALQREEILDSKAQLEKMLNRPIKSFSYPFGKQHDYTPETVALVQDAGFSVACSNLSGVVNRTTDSFQLPRVHVHDCGGAEFEARLLSKLYA